MIFIQIQPLQQQWLALRRPTARPGLHTLTGLACHPRGGAQLPCRAPPLVRHTAQPQQLLLGVCSAQLWVLGCVLAA